MNDQTSNKKKRGRPNTFQKPVSDYIVALCEKSKAPVRQKEAFESYATAHPEVNSNSLRVFVSRAKDDPRLKTVPPKGAFILAAAGEESPASEETCCCQAPCPAAGSSPSCACESKQPEVIPSALKVKPLRDNKGHFIKVAPAPLLGCEEVTL